MIDYLCDEDTGDLIIENGDFAKGTSEYKHVAVLCRSPKGAFRRDPLIGVGAIDYKNANVSKLPTLVREINVQMEAVGLRGASVRINQDNKIEIDV